eukprot:9414993-Pyramimonas_sp.AAC.4
MATATAASPSARRTMSACWDKGTSAIGGTHTSEGAPDGACESTGERTDSGGRGITGMANSCSWGVLLELPLDNVETSLEIASTLAESGAKRESVNSSEVSTLSRGITNKS